MLNVNELNRWETIIAPSENCDKKFNGVLPNRLPKGKYAFINLVRNSNGELLYEICDYNRNSVRFPEFNTFFSYVLTKEEIEKNFYVVGKVKKKTE